MRAQRTQAGYLGRDWLDVVVCHESIPGCGPMVWMLLGGGEGEESGADALPLFGGGPWIATGDQIVRFYDLTGAHEPGSPFANNRWLDAGVTGRATSADGRAGLTWNVTEAAPDTRRIEFVVDDVSGAYRFGLSLDPDLGKSPGRRPEHL